MAVFFSQISYKPTSEWKEEHVFWNPLGSNVVIASSVPGKDRIAAIAQPADATMQTFDPVAASHGALVGIFPDGTKAKLSPSKDPREVFADWLVTPKNPWFTRAIVKPRLGLVDGARHRPRAGRFPGQQPAEQSPRCWPVWKRNSSPHATI